MKTLKTKTANTRGFTIVELMVAVLMLGVVILAVGMVLADGQRGWSDMYSRVYSDVVTGGHVARRTFDSTIRKAGLDYISLADDGSWVQVQYYQDDTSTDFDRYARFYIDGDALKIERGTLDPLASLGSTTICSNVTSCVFSRIGKSVQMVLKLDNGSQQLTVVSSAVAHN